jgi:hypothetical protein
MIDKRGDVETMAERLQRERPDSRDGSEFMHCLGRIDGECIFKIVDDGLTIFF